MSDRCLRIEVPEAFREFADEAIVRLSALFPSILFRQERGIIVAEIGAEADDPVAIRKEAFNQLQRAKVYKDFLPVRLRMQKNLLGG